MMMLAESFFPNPSSKEFFREDLGGMLEVTANYDFIQISAVAHPDEFLTMLETVASAVSNPATDNETTSKLKAQRIEALKQMQSDPMHIADWAASKQLFGTFPYGRPEHGTIESVSKIEFADLIDAKQRFLTADNATISIGGNFDPTFAYRAARRLFGTWLKSDRIVPSTFKQPDQPDTKMVKLPVLNEGAPHIYFALRGVSRNDRDYAASNVLTTILESRVKENASAVSATHSFVTNEAHILPGSIVVGISSLNIEQIPSNLVTLLLLKPVTEAEFTAAKASALNDRRLHNPDVFWLDSDTFKLASAAEEQKAFEGVSLTDVQRVAAQLAKNPVVAVTVVKAEKAATN